MSNKVDTFRVAGSNVEVKVVVGEEPYEVKITNALLEAEGQLIGETYNGTIKAFTYQGLEYSTYQGEKVYATRQFYDKHVLAWNTDYSFTDADREYFAKQLISYTRGNLFDA